MKRTAIYPGTFDPVTLGHLDVIRRAAKVFDRLVVAVAEAPRKNVWFSLEERVRLLKSVTRGIPGVTVESFDGLLMDYVRDRGARVVVRGLRAFTDFEYEFQMALTNRKIAPDIETVFLMTSESHSYVSSTVVREVSDLGGDTSGLVPPVVHRALLRKGKQR
jgi:pantetheine-phosphate adenylyltransferase